MTVAVQLVQSVDIGDGCLDGPTLVSVLVGFPDDGPGSPAREYPLCLDLEQAQTVGRILHNLGRQALDEMVADAEDAGIYEATATPRPMR
jgi:hypothetical protein